MFLFCFAVCLFYEAILYRDYGPYPAILCLLPHFYEGMPFSESSQYLIFSSSFHPSRLSSALLMLQGPGICSPSPTLPAPKAVLSFSHQQLTSGQGRLGWRSQSSGWVRDGHIWNRGWTRSQARRGPSENTSGASNPSNGQPRGQPSGPEQSASFGSAEQGAPRFLPWGMPFGRTRGSWICLRGRFCWFSYATRLLCLPGLLQPTDSWYPSDWTTSLNCNKRKVDRMCTGEEAGGWVWRLLPEPSAFPILPTGPRAGSGHGVLNSSVGHRRFLRAIFSMSLLIPVAGQPRFSEASRTLWSFSGRH